MIGIDTDQVLDDIVALLQAGSVGLTLVGKNVDAAVLSGANMPLCDVRPFRLIAEPLATGSYYFTLIVELEIVAQDLSSPAEALRIVLDKLKLVQEILVRRPYYGGSWDSVTLGPTDFKTGQDIDSGAGAAGALSQVNISLYST